MRSQFLLLFASLSLCFTAGAQSGVVPPNATKIVQQSQSSAVKLTNQDVRDLLQAGLTPDELIAKINSSLCEFDVTPAAAQSLKMAGVSDEVIAAMVQIQAASTKNQIGNSFQTDQVKQIIIPSGTKLDVEVAYTVSSLDVHSGDLLSFRVLVPIIIDGVTVVEKGALVTGSILVAKRGGHWGKAGHLSWTMQDVVAVDTTRVPLQSGAEAGRDFRDVKSDTKVRSRTGNSVKGTSHGGEVATKMIIAGAIFPPLAPLGLMNGFKRGENAVLPEGKRFVVFVQSETSIKAARDRMPR